MNQENSQVNGASSLLRRFFLLLGIVVAAEVIVIVSILLSGGNLTGADLTASIVRILLVALSGWFLLMRGESDVSGHIQPEADHAPSPGAAEVSQVWPNIDQLTHTSNQRGLTIHMLEMMALAERYSHRLSLCLIQVGGLDKVSSEQREEILITTSAVLSEQVRIPDKVGRYEEALFMVIMPEADYAGASLVAGRLQSSLEKELGDGTTIHMGVAEFERGDDLQRLLARAQQALEKNS